MNLQHLEYYIEIVENKSVSKAAEKLMVSQPSLSRVLRSIEEEMGGNVKLTSRTPKGIEMTPEGEALYREAKKALNILNNAKISLSMPREGTAPLQIYGSLFQSPLDGIKAFQEAYPNISLEYNLFRYEYSNFQYPDTSRLDNTICIAPEPAESQTLTQLNRVNFRRYEAMVIVPNSHELAKRDSIRLDELQDERMIIPSEGSPYWYYIQELFQKEHFTPNLELPELADLPMKQIGELQREISVIFDRAGLQMDSSSELYISSYRNALMHKRNDIVLAYVRRPRLDRTDRRVLYLTGSQSVKYSCMFWPKEQPATRNMQIFIDFMQKYYL